MTHPLFAALGRAVREKRKSRRMSQAELARLVGFTRASIANLEAGRQRVPLDILYRIGQALGEDARKFLPTPKTDGAVRRLFEREAAKRARAEALKAEISFLRKKLAKERA